ncbi:hypothetical protein NQ315_009672 [Exocentrus adspersus]|uniref:Mitochondrial ribosomal protein S17 n=1 Tax=Exocentrus adspersus TaxID=1586481 RepID=A0AAV8WHU5_9CUCU|nr:hypothetical protein NQ315_009672 [Exocentrus adspersus]
MALPKAVTVPLMLGTCVPCLKQGAAKFRVKRLELDTNIHMYFANLDYVYAHDPQKLCKTGDLVLIEKLPNKLTRLITHRVKEVVCPLGDITDPLTGKKVVAGNFGGEYRDHIKAVSKIYGEKATAFNYKNAPPRGWQEDKKDFSHVDTYVKYHETGEPQPYSV